MTSSARASRRRQPPFVPDGSELTANVLDGRAVAQVVWEDVGRRASELHARIGVPPTLAIVRAGHDPASEAYLRQINRAFVRHGLVSRLVTLPPDAGPRELERVVAALDADTKIHGILIQLPLPAPLTFGDAYSCIPPTKDVEGIGREAAGDLARGRPTQVPSTPLAGLEILHAAGVQLRGASAVVLGRSAIVGRPMALLLLQEDATVTVCHSHTPDLGEYTQRADIVIAAIGRPGLVTRELVRPGATVIDFGINDVAGQLVGDVDFERVSEVAGAITPVPGGTGPVTTAVLARNLLDLAERRG